MDATIRDEGLKLSVAVHSSFAEILMSIIFVPIIFDVSVATTNVM